MHPHENVPAIPDPSPLEVLEATLQNYEAPGCPLTTTRLQAVLNALENGSARTLVFPELGLGS